MKKKLGNVWAKISKFFESSRLTSLERTVAFTIKKQREIEINVHTLQVEHKRITQDLTRAVESKIENYEVLFKESKEFGDNLIKVAIAVNDNINKGENKYEKK